MNRTCLERLTRVMMPVIALVLIAAACGGEGNTAGSETSSTGGTPDSTQWERVAPDGFAEIISEPDVVTINVHVPDDGQIEGTDLLVPYDSVEEEVDRLPSDRSTRLAVYCRSGSMSSQAIPTFLKLGYENVVELDGGFHAWEDAGYELLPPGSVQ